MPAPVPVPELEALIQKGERTLIPAPKPAKPEHINVYRCEECNGYTVTIDVHEGVTPFLLDCRANGKSRVDRDPEACNGMARSSMYRPVFFFGPGPWIPAWEWYAPTEEEAKGAGRGMYAHAAKETTVSGVDLEMEKIVRELDRRLNDAAVRARKDGRGSEAEQLVYAYRGALACLKPVVEKAKG